MIISHVKLSGIILSVRAAQFYQLVATIGYYTIMNLQITVFGTCHRDRWGRWGENVILIRRDTILAILSVHNVGEGTETYKRK